MHRFTLPLALLLASPLLAADSPSEPLPKGAIARLGTEKMKGLDGYGGLRLHPDGKHLIAMTSGKATLIELATGETKEPFGKGTRSPLAVSADGKRAVSSSYYENFTVYDVVADEVLYEVKGGKTLGGDYSITPDGKFLAAGGRPDEKTKKVTVTVFDVDAQKEVATLEVTQNASANLLLSADGKRGVSWARRVLASVERDPRQPFSPRKPVSPTRERGANR